eukprot:m.1039830 g.1039830  ORF g.1039830 m.1039830 type:complete len:50 (+) comp24150_c2_seq7:204-353(+)
MEYPDSTVNLQQPIAFCSNITRGWCSVSQGTPTIHAVSSVPGNSCFPRL